MIASYPGATPVPHEPATDRRPVSGDVRERVSGWHGPGWGRAAGGSELLYRALASGKFCASVWTSMAWNGLIFFGTS